jgi:hypothetical protein
MIVARRRYLGVVLEYMLLLDSRRGWDSRNTIGVASVETAAVATSGHDYSLSKESVP